jgi:D-alanyl-D-alanine carboxypeptidase
MRRIAAWGLLATVLALSPAATAAVSATPDARVVLDRVVEAGSPGALVLVDDRGSRVAVASGLAVLDGAVPLRPGDRFRVGSITKTFVAVVALQLVAERRLALDDTVEDWLPGLVPAGRRITLRDLLAHTSGLDDYAGDKAFLRRTVTDPRRRWSPRELVRVALRQGLVAPPGARFAYASTNYILLGMAIERATGTTLARLLRRRIIEPLRLLDTSFVPGSRISGPHAHGYAPSQHDGIVAGLATAVDRSRDGASWAWAAGAVVSTAPDLSRFLNALLRGDLVPKALLAQMLPTPGSRYGLGLAAFRTPCGTAIGHTGNLLGTVSAAWSSPDGARRVVAMTNSYPLSPDADTAFRSLLDTAFCGR